MQSGRKVLYASFCKINQIESVLKTLCCVPPTQYFYFVFYFVILLLLDSSYMDPFQYAQMIKNFSDIPCVLLKRRSRPSLILPIMTETRLGWWRDCMRLQIEIEHIEIFWPLEPQTIEDSNQDANSRGLSLCRQHQAAIQTAACPQAPVWTGANMGNAPAPLW